MFSEKRAFKTPWYSAYSFICVCRFLHRTGKGICGILYLSDDYRYSAGYDILEFPQDAFA